MDLVDLLNCPHHRAMEICVDVIQVLNNAHLVSITREEGDQLFVVHAAIDGALADLKAINVENRQDGT